MKVFRKIKAGRSARLGLLALSLTSLMLLLAACGDSSAADTDYTVYVPTGLQPLGQVSNDFRSSIMDSKRADVLDQQVQVYSTDQSLADLEKAYTDEMVNKHHWTDATKGILGSDELGTNGVVQAYEKIINGNNSNKKVVGIMLLGPNVKGQNNILDKLRSDNQVGTNKQLIVIIQGATGQAASTPTPK